MGARCFFCSAPCTDADLCRGCNSYVCAKCDDPIADNRPQGGGHKPEAHRAHVEAAS